MIALEGDELVVQCGEPCDIVAVGYGYRTQRVPGSGHLSGRLPLSLFKDGWVRVIVRNSAGRHAWTNPMWRSAPGIRPVANSF